MVFFTFIFFAQFCDIVKLTIIHKLTLSNLAIEKHERKRKNSLEKGGGDNIFQTIIEFVIFFPQFFITMQNLARQKDYHISYVKWNNIQY